MILLVILALLSLVLLGLYCCMLPAKGRKGKLKDFEIHFIAHRGLHDNRTAYPENSMAAFRHAVRRGYGIEMDVQLTRDNVPVVFHDSDLRRAAGDRRRVREMTFAELRQVHLFGSRETVPSLRQVLDMVRGDVPLVIELKALVKHRELCREVTALLDQYAGSYCIESFSPLVLRWFRKNRPDVLRGQLATNQLREGNYQFWYCSAILTWCLMNALSRPDFVSYNCRFSKSLPVRILRHLCKCKMAAWTVKSEDELEHCRKGFDVFIFDSFLPDGRIGEPQN